MRRHGLRPDKRLGQHFLFDPRILARIARAAGPLEGRTVLEVGPGPGGLTRALLAAGAAEVVAVERDPRCLEALAELAAAAGPRLRLVAGDALAFDVTGLAPPGELVIVANLPYNIGTELLLRWLERIDAIALMVLLFQKEVAQRLVATAGTRDYGRLSILAQSVCRIERLFDLPPAVFTPPPKVTSTLVRLVPRPDRPCPELLARLSRITAAAFGQRRKMLRQSLRSLCPDPEKPLAELGIAPTARAETLPPETFLALAARLSPPRSAAVPPAEPGTAERIPKDKADGDA